MPSNPRSNSNRAAARVAAAAGAALVGGALLAVALTLLNGARFPISYQFIASGLVGAQAFTAVRYAYMGVALHFAIAVFWALLYMLLAGHAGQLRRWAIGGAALGAGAWAGMQIVLIFAGLTSAPGGWLPSLAAIAEHVAFFGWPVAWLVRRS